MEEKNGFERNKLLLLLLLDGRRAAVNKNGVQFENIDRDGWKILITGTSGDNIILTND